jgi:DNA polymerase I-like protein with 3'-5' exonuclease and polymerase domains
LKAHIPFRGSSNGSTDLSRHFAHIEKLERERARMIVKGAQMVNTKPGAILVYDEDDEPHSYPHDESESIHLHSVGGSQRNTPPSQSIPRISNNSHSTYQKPVLNKVDNGNKSMIQQPVPPSSKQNSPIPIQRHALRELPKLTNNSRNIQSAPTKPESMKRRREETVPLDHQQQSKRFKSELYSKSCHHNFPYKIEVVNPSRMNTLLDTWAKQTYFAFNVVYTSVAGAKKNDERVKAIHTISGISVCWAGSKQDMNGKPIVDIVYHLVITNPLILEQLKPILENPNSIKISVDMKLSYRILMENGIVLPSSNLRDVIVADHFIQPSEETSNTDKRKPLSTAFTQIIASGLLDAVNTKDIANSLFVDSAQTAIHCFRLMLEQETLMETHQIFDSYNMVDMPLVPVLATLESQGVRFVGNDGGENSIINQWVSIVLDAQDQLTQEVKDYLRINVGPDASARVDLQNRDKVEATLYDDLGLRMSVKGKSGKRSTKGDVLDELALKYPDLKVMQHISMYRTLNIIRTKHLNSFSREHVVLDARTGQRKVYARQMNTASVTGRLAVTAPNLQSVPHDISFEHPKPTSEMIQQALVQTRGPPIYTISVRSLFVPRDPEKYTMISADYQQIELRMIAYLSNDQDLLSLLEIPNSDPFRSMAQFMFNLEDESLVSSEQRAVVKQLWYGTIYGMGKITLSKKLQQVLRSNECNSSFNGATRLKTNLHNDDELATSYAHQFSQRFKVMDKYRRQYVRDTLLEKGYVTTISGRKRFWDDAPEKQRDEGLFGKYCRDALSTIVQGSAADIFKAAIIRTDQKLKELNSSQPPHQPIASLLLHIHDELVFEVKKEYVTKLSEIVKQEMENAASFFGFDHMYFPVKLRQGDNWAYLK